jgi:protein TonB
MFNNLIESSSHKTELKRRGSYFLFTTATYLVLFAVAGVLSIYAYDARLEEPASEIVMLSPLDYQPPQATLDRAPAPRNLMSADPNVAVRRVAMANVNQPQVVPEAISATPNTNLPIPRTGMYRIGNEDLDPIGVSGAGRSNGTGNGVEGGRATPVIDVGTPPPTPVAERAKPKVIRKQVINGDAVSLPKPPYPPMAKQMRIQGPVSVQVLVDESGKVVSAKAVSGNPALIHAAQKAALGARFSPTMLGDQPVKVSGVITYNFVLQ